MFIMCYSVLLMLLLLLSVRIGLLCNITLIMWYYMLLRVIMCHYVSLRL